jgi:hypothetical protein
MISVSCADKYVAYNNDKGTKGSCNNNTVLLRPIKQSGKYRRQWRLKAEFTTGVTPEPSAQVAIGRLNVQACPETPYFQLAAAKGGKTLLGGSGWKNSFIPVDPAKDCNIVWIQASSGNESDKKFLNYPNCESSSQTAYTWSPASSSTKMQWKLVKLSDYILFEK